jgi:hypothetical protein
MIVWIIVIAIFCFLLGVFAGLFISVPFGFEDRTYHDGEKK